VSAWCSFYYMETKQTRREKPIHQEQKAGIVTSLNDTTLTKVTYGKYATRVPDEVAYGIYECFSSQCNTLLHIVKVTISVTLQYFTWQMKGHVKDNWMKIWNLNSSVKNHSISPSHVWKLSSFFIACQKQSLFIFEFKNLTRKQKKTFLWFWCGLL